MITWIQKYHHGLLVVFLFVTIISMVMLFNPASNMDAMRNNGNRVAKLYGQTVDIETYRRYMRLFSLAQELEMGDYLQGLIGNPSAAMDYEDLFVYNTMVLRKESEKLQLNPSSEEMVAALQEIPHFQTDGHFDTAKLNSFLQESLASRGFTQSQLDDIIRDSLCLQNLQKMIGASVPPPVGEARRFFDLGNQRTLIQAVQLNVLDFAKEVQPTDDEIQKDFELHETSFRTEEKRRVEYVIFKTPEDPAKATEAPKDPAKPEEVKKPSEEERLAKLKRQDETARKATDFVISLTSDSSPDAFKTKAAALGLEIKSTELFESNGSAKELDLLGRNAIRAAQQLSEDVPVSDAVPTKDDFAVLHLAEVAPSQPMPLADAKPQVIEELKEKLGKEKMEARAEELRSLFLDGIAAGKTFEDIAKEQKLTLITPPPYRLNEQPRDFENISELSQAAVYLKAGGVSQRVDIPGGALLVHVKQREVASPELWETEKDSNLNGLQKGLERQFLSNWFASSREKANLERFAAASSAAKKG